jgi:hypothetical protein
MIEKSLFASFKKPFPVLKDILSLTKITLSGCIKHISKVPFVFNVA